MSNYITLFYLGCCYSMLVSIEIRLNNFTQDDCSTQCKSGLLLSRDTCQLTSTIIFEKVVPNQTTLVYFENTGQKLPTLFSLDIPTECKGFKENADHYCTKVEETIYNVTIIVRALKSFSKAKIIGYMTSPNGSRIYSDAQTLPEMYDTKDIRGHLRVNGLNITTDSCNATVDDHTFNLEFHCYSQAKPCIIEITANDSTVVNQSENHAVFTHDFKSETELNVVIKYSACSLDWKYNVVKCRFQNALFRTSDHQSNLDTAAIVVPIACVAVTCAIAIFIYFMWNRRVKEKKDTFGSAEENKKTAADTEMEKDNLIAKPTPEEKVDTNSPSSDNRKDHLNSDETGPLAANCDAIIDLKSASQAAHDKHTSKSKDENDLMDAIRNNDVGFAKKLITYIADVNEYKDKSGLSFLMCASKHGSTEILSELIDFGADVEAIDLKGSNALMYASEMGFVEIAEILIKHRAKINARDNFGQTPLMYATHYRKIIIAEMLIKYGADVNTKNKNCFTALMHASRNGYIKIADLLIKSGADINCRDTKSCSALKYASENGRHEIVALLTNAGAM